VSAFDEFYSLMSERTHQVYFGMMGQALEALVLSVHIFGKGTWVKYIAATRFDWETRAR